MTNFLDRPVNPQLTLCLHAFQVNSSHDAITFAYQYLRYFFEARPKLFPFPPQTQTKTRMNTKR